MLCHVSCDLGEEITSAQKGHNHVKGGQNGAVEQFMEPLKCKFTMCTLGDTQLESLLVPLKL